MDIVSVLPSLPPTHPPSTFLVELFRIHARRVNRIVGIMRPTACSMTRLVENFGGTGHQYYYRIRQKARRTGVE